MESRQQIEEIAAAWIARRDVGPWTDADAAGLQEWLAQSASHRAAYYRLNAAWEEAGRLRAFAGVSAQAGEGRGLNGHDDPAASSSAPPSFLRRPEPRERTRGPRRHFFSLVASVLILAIAATAWYLWPTGPSYRTAVGGLAAVPLPDGSRVTLNTDSEIRVDLAPTERRIDLGRGEAFFEVAKDPNRPFVVHAGDKRIIAVGTQFSVRREGDDVRVVVSEGVVRMERTPGLAQARQPVSLPAGTIARERAGDVLIQQKSAPEIEQSLSWRTGSLTFRDTPLADAVAEFNRYNTRKIVIDDPAIAAIQVGGIFRATNLDPFVHLLEEGFPVRVEDEGNRIILTSK